MHRAHTVHILYVEGLDLIPQHDPSSLLGVVHPNQRKVGLLIHGLLFRSLMSSANIT